ncbi:ribosome assembly protein 4, partial [Colletotrichum filicis]
SQDNSGTALPSSTKIWDFPQKPGAVGARLVPSDISSDAPVVVCTRRSPASIPLLSGNLGQES